MERNQGGHMDRKQGKQYVIRALISAVGITYVWNLAIVSIYPLMIFGICVYLYAQEKQDDKISVYIKGTARQCLPQKCLP